MFSLLTGAYDSYFASPQLNLLLVGGQGAGKTALLERFKVTQITPSRRTIATTPTPLPTEKEKEVDRTPVESPVLPKKRTWCPAPARYSNTVMDDDDIVDAAEAKPILPPTTPAERQSTDGSLQSVELTNSFRLTQEFDLKPKAKMLPLSKIRPTIGMNLAKLKVPGALCHVWDLGGRLHDLWERYYNDCDAAIFVYKWGSDVVPEEDERPELTPELQNELLQQVRSSIPDEVPFLILLHTYESSPFTPNTLYSTNAFLPHYHNPLQALFVVNAKTGEGVRAALEWLLPLTRRRSTTKTVE